MSKLLKVLLRETLKQPEQVVEAPQETVTPKKEVQAVHVKPYDGVLRLTERQISQLAKGKRIPVMREKKVMFIESWTRAKKKALAKKSTKKVSRELKLARARVAELERQAGVKPSERKTHHYGPERFKPTPCDWPGCADVLTGKAGLAMHKKYLHLKGHHSAKKEAPKSKFYGPKRFTPTVCDWPGCGKVCKGKFGVTSHKQVAHLKTRESQLKKWHREQGHRIPGEGATVNRVSQNA